MTFIHVLKLSISFRPHPPQKRLVTVIMCM